MEFMGVGGKHKIFKKSPTYMKIGFFSFNFLSLNNLSFIYFPPILGLFDLSLKKKKLLALVCFLFYRTTIIFPTLLNCVQCANNVFREFSFEKIFNSYNCY